MENKRKARPRTALLSKNGYLRLSSDLFPRGYRKSRMKFVLTPLPPEKQLIIKVVTDGREKHLAKRKAMYSNNASLCPLVAVRSAIRFMGMRMPVKSQEYPVKKERNGDLVVQF